MRPHSRNYFCRFNATIYCSCWCNFGFTLALFTICCSWTCHKRSFLVGADTLNLQSIRAKKARLALRIGKNGASVLLVIVFVLALFSLLLFFTSFSRIAYLTSAVSLAILVFVVWYKQDLSVLQSTDDSLGGQLTKDVLGRLKESHLNRQ